MMELVDVTDSKSVGSDTVWVRVPLPAPKIQPHRRWGCIFDPVGLEQGGGAAAANTPVECWLARGRVPPIRIRLY